MTTITNKPIDGQSATVEEGRVEQESTEQVLAGLFDDAAIAQLAEQARSRGIDLPGNGSLLQQLTKRVLEAALDQEMDEHLGRERYVRRWDNRGQRAQRFAVQDIDHRCGARTDPGAAGP